MGQVLTFAHVGVVEHCACQNAALEIVVNEYTLSIELSRPVASFATLFFFRRGFCILFSYTNHPPIQFNETNNKHWPDLVKSIDSLFRQSLSGFITNKYHFTVNIAIIGVRKVNMKLIDWGKSTRLHSGYVIFVFHAKRFHCKMQSLIMIVCCG